MATMGAAKTKENLQTELQELQRQAGSTMSKTTIHDFLEVSIKTGVMSLYIEHAVIVGAAKYGANDWAVFVHGGLHPNMIKNNKLMLPSPPLDDNSFQNSKGDNKHMDTNSVMMDRSYIPYDEVPADSGVEGWVAGFKSWKEDIYLAWKAATLADMELIIDSIEDNGQKKMLAVSPGATLMDMGLGTLGGSYRNAGHWEATPIVEVRYGVHPDFMPDDFCTPDNANSCQHPGPKPQDKPISPSAFAKILYGLGIKRVFSGHYTQHGQLVPEIIKPNVANDFLAVNLDTTYGRPCFKACDTIVVDDTTLEQSGVPEADFRTLFTKDGRVEIKGQISKLKLTDTDQLLMYTLTNKQPMQKIDMPLKNDGITRLTGPPEQLLNTDLHSEILVFHVADVTNNVVAAQGTKLYKLTKTMRHGPEDSKGKKLYAFFDPVGYYV